MLNGDAEKCENMTESKSCNLTFWLWSIIKRAKNQFNQCNEQITMLQANNSELRMQIAKQQGVIEALQSLEKGSKNAKKW